MKILVLQDHLRNGGTERQSVLLANAFATAGHATTLLTFRPGGTLAGTVASTVVHHSLQPFDTHLNWFTPHLGRMVNRTGPNMVLCMGRMANCQVEKIKLHHPAWEWPDDKPVKIIATMRTGKPLPPAFRRGLRCCDHIVANSHEAARVLSATYAVPTEKIAVIHNSLVFPVELNGDAMPPSRFETSRETLRTQYAATPATTILLCVAMFRPEKNQRALIRLAARLPGTADWQLWFAGEGETRQACIALAAQLGLAARVKFLGFQPDPAPLYRAADIAVLTSQSESLPNFLIEAQAHGLTIVTDDTGGVRECFLPGETGWAVPPGDANAFLAALTPLLADSARRTAIAPKARAFARDSFSPARQIQLYLDLFAHLASVSAR